VVCGAPVALAERFRNVRPQLLLTIHTHEGSWRIEAPANIDDVDPVLSFSKSSRTPRTELTVKLPNDGFREKEKTFFDPIRYSRQVLVPAYFLFNPWVKFEATAQASTGNWSIVVQPAGSLNMYRGLTSIYWYSLGDFRQLISDLCDSAEVYGDVKVREFMAHFKGLSADDAQLAILRELRIKNLSLRRIANNQQLMRKLFAKMKSQTTPPSSDALGRLGKKVIRKGLKQIFGRTLVEPIFYKHINDAADADDRQVPYVVEVAVAKTSGDHLQEFYGINNSPFLREYMSDDPFTGVKWEWKAKRGKKGEAISLPDFLHEQFGKGEGAVLVVHAICPNLRVIDYAKSRYDFSPTGSKIAQLLYEVLKQFRENQPGSITRKRASVIFLQEELERRKKLLEYKGAIPEPQWTTQQAIYYLIRKRMGGDIGMKRKSFIQAINRECRSLGGSLYREKLGIKAADRAQFFHRGTESPVSFESIEALSKKGSDILLIEKEGVADVLESFARKRGVAIINSRGFAVDYAKEIMRIAAQRNANIFLLTDLDAPGLVMARGLPSFPRIGVDERMIREAGEFAKIKLERQDVQEKYSPQRKHYHSKLLSDMDREQVANTRVEIDALLGAVGREALWKAIEVRMLEEAKTRDLRRSLEPEVLLPDYLAEPIEKIRNAAISIGKPILERKLNRYAKSKYGMIDVDKMEKRIENSVVSEMSKDTRLKRISPILKKAVKTLD
jgi:5S rRNA maturation endonuclease (ribonuclease M5)